MVITAVGGVCGDNSGRWGGVGERKRKIMLIEKETFGLGC